MAAIVNDQNLESLLSYSLGTTLGTAFDCNYDFLSSFIDNADKIANNKNFKFERRYEEWRFFSLSDHLQSILVFDKFQKKQINQNKDTAAQVVASVVKKHFTEVSKQFWLTPSIDPEIRQQANYLVSFHPEGRPVPAASKEEIDDLFYRERRQSVRPTIDKIFINIRGGDLSSAPTEYAVDDCQYTIILNPPLAFKPATHAQEGDSPSSETPLLKNLEKGDDESVLKSLFSRNELLTEDSFEEDAISDPESEDPAFDGSPVSASTLEEIIISGLQRSVAEKTEIEGLDGSSSDSDANSEMSLGSNNSSPRSN